MKTKRRNDTIPFPSQPLYQTSDGTLHGMGCILEETEEPFSSKKNLLPQEETEYTVTLDRSKNENSFTGLYLGERMCPECHAHLDFDAYERRYRCLACGYRQGDVNF